MVWELGWVLLWLQVLAWVLEWVWVLVWVLGWMWVLAWDVVGALVRLSEDLV